jgi:sugar phosphate permease
MKEETKQSDPGRALSLVIMASITVIYFFSYLQRVAVPGTIFDELQSAFSAPASAITALGVIFLIIYGGMQLVVGVLTDRVGVFKVLLAGGVTLCAGSLIFPMAHTLPVLYTARGLVAFGASLIFASVVKRVLMRYSPHASFPFCWGFQ